jgi:hypothetical protein
MAPAKRTTILLCVFLVAACAATPSVEARQRTFSSGNLNLTIPDAVGIQSFPITTPIRVKARGKIKDVNVAARISIPDDRDLDLSIEGPIGRTGGFAFAHLKNHGFLNSPKGQDFGSGPATCNGTSTVFDDQAATSILQGQPPYAGSFIPEEPLRPLKRGRLAGKWTMSLMDFFPGSIGGPAGGAPGVLHCWSMTITYKPLKRK